MTIDKLSNLEETSLAKLNEILRKLDDDKWEVVQLTANPTDINQRQIAIVDTGRIYMKQADGTMIYFTKDG